MVTEEARLRLALIAHVTNASGEFPSGDAKTVISVEAGVEVSKFTVTRSYPVSFLVVCASPAGWDRIMAASPIPMADTSLSMRPWTRLARTSDKVLMHKMVVELDGIPEHAWDLDTASKLMARHTWIEKLDPATAAKEDMTTFRLTTWTADPFTLPTTKMLRAAEPEVLVVHSNDELELIFGNLPPYLCQKRTLQYPIMFHLCSIIDFRPRTPSISPSSLSDDGDNGPDGNPDRSYGFRLGHGLLLSGFSHKWGNTGGGTGGGAGGSVTPPLFALGVGTPTGPTRPQHPRNPYKSRKRAHLLNRKSTFPTCIQTRKWRQGIQMLRPWGTIGWPREVVYPRPRPVKDCSGKGYQL